MQSPKSVRAFKVYIVFVVIGTALCTIFTTSLRQRIDPARNLMRTINKQQLKTLNNCSQT